MWVLVTVAAAAAAAAAASFEGEEAIAPDQQQKGNGAPTDAKGDVHRRINALDFCLGSDRI